MFSNEGQSKKAIVQLYSTRFSRCLKYNRKIIFRFVTLNGGDNTSGIADMKKYVTFFNNAVSIL